MEQFIELKQSSEFMLFTAGVMVIAGFVGFEFGEYQKGGGKLLDIFANLNYSRAKAIFWGIVK